MLCIGWCSKKETVILTPLDLITYCNPTSGQFPEKLISTDNICTFPARRKWVYQPMSCHRQTKHWLSSQNFSVTWFQLVCFIYCNYSVTNPIQCWLWKSQLLLIQWKVRNNRNILTSLDQIKPLLDKTGLNLMSFSLHKEYSVNISAWAKKKSQWFSLHIL